MNVLITGSRAPVAMELAQRFHRAGHRVFQADSLPAGMAMRSRAVEKSYVVPRPVAAFDAYVNAITSVIENERIDVVVPTCEEVFFLAAAADRLPCRCFFDNFTQLSRIHNKWTFSQFAANNHATVPETRILTSVDDFAASEDVRQWVFKPVYSRFASRVVIGPNESSLRRIDPAAEPWIAQRRVEGTEYSTYSVAIDGRLLAHCCYHSLYRVGTGSGICFQPVDIPKIESFVREFVLRTKYTGQIGFDIIIDTHEKLWVLEGNPRATSGAQLFAKSDRLIDAFLSDNAGNPEFKLIKPSTFRPGMIEFAMPVWGVVDAFRRGRIHRFPFDILRSRWLCCSLRDFWPALGLPLSLWQLIRIARREKCSLQQASTFDIEWNGEDL